MRWKKALRSSGLMPCTLAANSGGKRSIQGGRLASVLGPAMADCGWDAGADAGATAAGLAFLALGRCNAGVI
jgi:hypothetical protein